MPVILPMCSSTRSLPASSSISRRRTPRSASSIRTRARAVTTFRARRPGARPTQAFLRAVGPYDANGMPASYPGSPAVAQTLLRAQDRIALCEAHPEEKEKLIAALGRDARLSIVGTDGYVALNAYCPPRERRGLVLIDPPF